MSLIERIDQLISHQGVFNYYSLDELDGVVLIAASHLLQAFYKVWLQLGWTKDVPSLVA